MLFARDLVLLHPPSVYDFRKRGGLAGPISDVVPSTPVFEMYPMGLTTIAGHLENHGFNVTIVNVAYRMLADAHYDAEAEIARLKPALFGIDLHWLPHAHGALALAELVKKHHPDTPVVMGGLSASYYHRELIERPVVDFVLRGDSTEEPMLRLLEAVRFGGSLAAIPNLTWKTPAGDVVENPLSHVPSDIDDVPLPNYEYVIRSVFKYGSLANVMPYLDWLAYPITALLTSRGCRRDCAICGGSRSAYESICNRRAPAFRSPEALVRDILRIQEFSRAPIFLVHDIRQGGLDYAERLLALLARERIHNEIIFELFYPAGDDFFRALRRAVPRFSLELTLETQVPELRRLNGKFACSNEDVERTIAGALRNGAGRIDLFFMTGLPRQTRAHALSAVDYCRHLLTTFAGDKRLWFFVAPLAPFLDPGSLAFEHPERYGVRLRYRTLEEHRAALEAPTWKHVLNYETDAMTRDDIVDVTYESAARLAELKRDFGFIDESACQLTLARIGRSRMAIAELDAALATRDPAEREARIADVIERLGDLQAQTTCAKSELRWPIRRRFTALPRLARIALGQFAREWRVFFGKRIPLALRWSRGVPPSPRAADPAPPPAASARAPSRPRAGAAR